MVSLRWSGEHTSICKGGVASCGLRPLHEGGGGEESTKLGYIGGGGALTPILETLVGLACTG